MYYAIGVHLKRELKYTEKAGVVAWWLGNRDRCTCVRQCYSEHYIEMSKRITLITKVC